MWDWLKGKQKQEKALGQNTRQTSLDDDLESKDSKLRKALSSWVMVLLGVSVLLSVQLPYFQEVHKRAAVFVEELAFALILAGLFSLTVEKYHREEFRKFVIVEREKLKRDVFLYAYGHAIHEETRQQIKDRILDCPFHREQLRLEWHMSPTKDAKDKIRVTKTFSYVQRNGTKLPQKYSYKLHQNTTSSILVQVAQDQTQSVRIRRRSNPGNIPDVHLEKSYVQLSGKPLEPGDIRELETDEIGELQPGEEIEVSVTICETRLMSDDDSYSSKHPIVGLSTVLVHVEGDLNLTASAYCKSQPLEQRTEHNPPRLYAWQTRDGILPFQGIMVSWSPVDPKEVKVSTPRDAKSAPASAPTRPPEAETKDIRNPA